MLPVEAKISFWSDLRNFRRVRVPSTLVDWATCGSFLQAGYPTRAARWMTASTPSRADWTVTESQTSPRTSSKKRFEQQTESLEEALTRVDARPELPDAYTVRGYTRVMEEAERLVGTAKERLVLSGWPRELEVIAAELKKAHKRKGKKHKRKRR